MSDEKLSEVDGMIWAAMSITAPESVSEEPTARLRFIGGRLQQEFVVSRWQGGMPLNRGTEWRDVPSVSLADATPNQNSRSEG